jgi:hypothetical protein
MRADQYTSSITVAAIARIEVWGWMMIERKRINVGMMWIVMMIAAGEDERNEIIAMNV